MSCHGKQSSYKVVVATILTYWCKDCTLPIKFTTRIITSQRHLRIHYLNSLPFPSFISAFSQICHVFWSSPCNRDKINRYKIIKSNVGAILEDAAQHIHSSQHICDTKHKNGLSNKNSILCDVCLCLLNIPLLIHKLMFIILDCMIRHGSVIKNQTKTVILDWHSKIFPQIILRKIGLNICFLFLL